MKSLVLAIALIFNLGVSAQQLGFDFGHADDILRGDIYPGGMGVVQVEFNDIPEPVKEEVYHADPAFELADGYYNYLSTAYYEISRDGKVIGYMTCSVLDYTEDPGLYLTAIKFNLRGKRITGHEYDELILNFYEDVEEVRQDLPVELHPAADYEN